jgi:hypothetical protein
MYTFQDLGEKSWFQGDGMIRMNRVIGNRLQGHSSSRVFKKDLSRLAGRATGRGN